MPNKKKLSIIPSSYLSYLIMGGQYEYSDQTEYVSTEEDIRLLNTLSKDYPELLHERQCVIVAISKEDLITMHRWLNVSYENAEECVESFDKQDTLAKINHFREVLNELEIIQ